MFIGLPIFILLCAFVYLVIVYGFLKMAETESRDPLSNHRGNSQRIETSKN